MGSWDISGGSGHRGACRVSFGISFLLLALVLSACAPSASLKPSVPQVTDDPLPGTDRPLPSEENEPDWGAPSAFPDYEFAVAEGPAGSDRSGATRSGESRSGASRSGESSLGASSSGSATRGGSAGRSGDSEDMRDAAGRVVAGEDSNSSITRRRESSEANPEGARTARSDAVDPPPVLPQGMFFTVQLLVATSRDLADDWKTRASGLFEEKVRLDFEDQLYKLRVGAVTTEEGAEELRRRAVALGYADARVVRVPGRGDSR